MAPRGVEDVHHRIGAAEDPQPPAVADLALWSTKTSQRVSSACIKTAGGSALVQGLVQRGEQRLQTPQAVGHGAGATGPSPASCQCWSNRSVGRWLANLSSRISTHIDTPRRPLGISLGTGGAVTVARPGTGTRPLIAPPRMRSAPIDVDLDLQLFRHSSAPQAINGRPQCGQRRFGSGGSSTESLRGPADGYSPGVWAQADLRCWPRGRGGLGLAGVVELVGAIPVGAAVPTCVRRLGLGACGFRRGGVRAAVRVQRGAGRPGHACRFQYPACCRSSRFSRRSPATSAQRREFLVELREPGRLGGRPVNFLQRR